MDPENYPQIGIVDERSARKEKVRKAINGIAFILAVVGNGVSIVLGVPMLETCYNVALIVMIIGGILGFIQVVPEAFRNFVKLEPHKMRLVNYFYGFIIALRIFWLITATVVTVKAQCNFHDVIQAWICIYINWGVFVIIITIVFTVVVVRFLKRKCER